MPAKDASGIVIVFVCVLQMQAYVHGHHSSFEQLGLHVGIERGLPKRGSDHVYNTKMS